MNGQYNLQKLSVFFQDMLSNKELMFQIFDMFPLPIEVFAPDGTTVYINRASMELNGVLDASLVEGKYNLLNDPVCNDQLGYRDVIQRVFQGEAAIIYDFPAPIQDLVDRGIIGDKPYESALIDMYFYSALNAGEIAYVICIFVVKNMYHDHPKVAKAKEYIDSHWQVEFDADTVAKLLKISLPHLRALFKKHTGETMYDYYKNVKVERIKEKLADKNLTVAKAFSACGVNSRGSYARIFREITGMSPKEYRGSLK